ALPAPGGARSRPPPGGGGERRSLAAGNPDGARGRGRARVRPGGEHLVRRERRADRRDAGQGRKRRLGRQRAGCASRARRALLRSGREIMEQLLREIEAKIAGAKAATAKQNVGVISEIGDGVARIEGLTDAMLNEMIDLGHGVTGIALNLDETEVGVIILGDYTQLEEGDEVRTTGKLLQVPVGKGLLGRVVNTLGQPLDGKGPVKADTAYSVERTASGIITREKVTQPVQTGIKAIDAMIPIGRGQRELIIGDRSTGKTTLCIDT